MRAFRVVRIVFEIILIFLVLWFLIQRPTTEDKQLRQTKATIDHLYIKFEGYIREGDFASAYELMSPSFKADKNLESFTILFRFIQGDEKLRLHPQRDLIVHGTTARLFPEDDAWEGMSFVFEKIEGKWYFTGEIIAFQD